MMTEHSQYKLTQYSHGAGCGCKISPQVLDTILKTNISIPDHPQLLVGNGSRDDAAVYDLQNGTALISTTDFFMPIVDDAFAFGKIAGANAISDVYAMGGRPILAIAILGWPVDKLPATLAQQVIEGARAICAEAGIPLAGGHSIDSPEPIFGLAVNGLVSTTQLKRNDTAKQGDKLFLTKPLGMGVLSTAQKRGLLSGEDEAMMQRQLMELNSVGELLGEIEGVHAMTDVTGFGLGGHLVEMCSGSGLQADIFYDKLPIIPAAKGYLTQNAIPGGTRRNWNSYGHHIDLESIPGQSEVTEIIPDPQTNGGLLISVAPFAVETVSKILEERHLYNVPIGQMLAKSTSEILITVR